MWIQVENILLAGPGFYKVCDFGSSTTPKTAPQSMQEIQLLEAELNKHTTLQYRAPEMCDVWSRKEIGLPAGRLHGTWFYDLIANISSTLDRHMGTWCVAL